MVTTLDHISNGRAVLGIGAAWSEAEHRGFGVEFGSGFGERLEWLDEAVELILGMLRGAAPDARGPHYRAEHARNDPSPLQSRLPILIGGGGEKKTLATVARYADMWDIDGDVERVQKKDRVLRDWCARIGRDEAEIERVHNTAPVIIRDSVREARRVARGIGEGNGGWSGPDILGPPELVVEYVAPFVELGFRHLWWNTPSPYDRESLERLIGEVKPAVEALGL